jgi:hypothetical protein
MSTTWHSQPVRTEQELFEVLTELRAKHWLCRGQPRPYGCLVPSIDRGALAPLPRAEKLMRERRSINFFKSTARFFMPGEQQNLSNDVGALMVLRNYGVPTRLLDWSLSPYVAAYFGTLGDENEDGEIWTFDHDAYAEKGAAQWIPCGGFPQAESRAFLLQEPDNWFVCYFYGERAGFPRQSAQDGFCSMTPRFGCDHANAIAALLEDGMLCARYKISGSLKPSVQKILYDQHGIWRGGLFPDSSGAADTTLCTIFPESIDATASRCH